MNWEIGAHTKQHLEVGGEGIMKTNARFSPIVTPKLHTIIPLGALATGKCSRRELLLPVIVGNSTIVVSFSTEYALHFL
jgi:hypothetical protein